MEKELESMLHKDIPFHHFYLIEGEPEVLIPRLHAALLRRGIPILQNPLVTTERYETFLVEDAEKLRANAAEKKDTAPRISIVALKAITLESAQSLLKVLEEPLLNTHFFFIVLSIEHIIPTLRSRATIIKREYTKEEINNKEIKTFIVSAPSKRLVIVSKMLEKHKNDDTSGGLRYEALQFINELETILSQSDTINAQFLKKYSDILIARKYLSERSGSVKMILEHLALVI